MVRPCWGGLQGCSEGAFVRVARGVWIGDAGGLAVQDGLGGAAQCCEGGEVHAGCRHAWR